MALAEARFVARLEQYKRGNGDNNICPTAKKTRSFPLRISAANVTKSAVFCGVSHISWGNP